MGRGKDKGREGTYDEVQAEGIIEIPRACFFERGDDFESAWGEDDSEGEPEAAVGGEGGGAEGVAYGHFPDHHYISPLPWRKRDLTPIASHHS